MRVWVARAELQEEAPEMDSAEITARLFSDSATDAMHQFETWVEDHDLDVVGSTSITLVADDAEEFLHPSSAEKPRFPPDQRV